MIVESFLASERCDGLAMIVAVGDDEAEATGRLARLRDHLDAAQRIAGLGSWELELASGATHWSPHLDAIFCWPPGDGGHERLLAVVHPDDRRAVADAHAAAVRDGAPYAVDHRIVRADGIRHVHQEVVVEHEDDGRPSRLIGTVQDVTERTRLARRQADTESRRRELLHRLVQASDAARSQLAGDLHDGPVQVLTATAMRLEVLALGAERPPWLDDVLPVVREVCAQLREVLYELHPQVDDGGVSDAVAQLCATVLPGTPARVVVRGDEPAREATRAVQGIVQEALWDVREHDSADELTVVVQADDATVDVDVDAGAGSQPLLTRFGLLGVRERCEALGGTASLDAGRRVLHCTLPTRVSGGRR